MVVKGTLNGSRYVQFLKRLMHRNASRPVFLIVDGHPGLPQVAGGSRLRGRYRGETAALLPAAVDLPGIESRRAGLEPMSQSTMASGVPYGKERTT